MLESTKQLAVDTILFNSILGIFLYWLPLSFCVLGYGLRTLRNIQDDRARRHTNNPAYYPHETYGDIIGRAFVSVVPIANLWAAVFDVAPQLFGRLFRWFSRVLDAPVVPPRSKD